MKYWQLWPSHDGLQISASIKIDYKANQLIADATDKDGQVTGSLKDDYPAFWGAKEEIFSTRLANAIMSLAPEGVMLRPITAILPKGIEKDKWCELVVSAYVDCIDIERSELDLDEETGEIDSVDKLVINSAKADKAGYDMFRLHEEFTTVLVSDRIKQAIEAINPIGIRFKPTDGSDPDWYQQD